jgi:hypothetical protein
LPLLIIRPFLPESPAWQIKRAEGTLRRPSILQIFQPMYLRTSLVSAAIFACGFGAAFGTIQMTPQIVPGLVSELPKLVILRKQYEEAKQQAPEAAATLALKERVGELNDKQQKVVGNVQLWQELGGLTGRLALAWLVLRIASRRRLLHLFLIPGLVLIPLIYFFPAAGKLPQYNLELLKVGIFITGFLTIAQFSFWGNYLPLVYPTNLRGTGESFAANVGGRMVGTAFNPLTTIVLAPLFLSSIAGLSRSAAIAWAAGTVALLVYGLGTVLTFLLPEPKSEKLQE